jgi:hypothetical protein
MKNTLTLIILFLAGLHPLAFGEDQNKKKPEMDLSMALQHYEIMQKGLPLQIYWPEEYFKGFPQLITLKKEVNSREDLDSMLKDRPQKFKDKDIVYQILERNGFYIVALLPFGQSEPTQRDERVLSKAYVISKGTKKLFCWMNW